MKVYITGMGTINPVGDSVDESWNALLNGKHGFEKVTAFDPVNYRSQIAAEVTTDLVAYGKEIAPGLNIHSVEDSAKLSVLSTHMALEQAGLDKETLTELNAGVIMGSGFGGILYAEDPMNKIIQSTPYIPKVAHPFTVPFAEPNFVASLLSRLWGLQGIQYSVCTACSSGTHAIGQAMAMIQSGKADMVVTGGYEKTVSPLTYAAFDQLRAMSASTDPDTASTPFSTGRSGFVLGEGAATLILESEEQVQKRGVKPIAELVGYGASGGAFHMVKPKIDASDVMQSMRNAIKDAGISPQDVGAINAHGTSTQLNDISELTAVSEVFKDNEKPLIVAANKASIGHCVGAAGAIEAVFAAKTLETGIHAPIYNFSADEKLDYSKVMIPESVHEDNSIEYIISNSFGFGNNNATIILKKV